MLVKINECVRLNPKQQKIYLLIKNRFIWRNQGPKSARRLLYAKFKPIDYEAVNFINFVRSFCLPVTKSHVQACTR